MDVLSTVATVLADHGGDHHGWGDGWMWVWGPIMMVFWVAVIVLAVYWVARTVRPRGPDGGRAEDILAERYARGELTTDEYRERLDALR